MKRTVYFAALLVVAAWTMAEPAGAESTVFTYQGVLKDGGVPYDGTVNLSFSIWNSISGGTMLAGPIDQAGVSVNDGLFSVPINVGNPAAVFNGDSRWLAITVNGTLLTPRQEITPAPFSMFSSRPWATNGANVSYNGGNVGIGTTTPGHPLSVVGTIHSTTGGFRFPDGTVQTTASTGGAGFWSANGTNIFSNNTGNVGIGTNSPLTPLDVRGDLTLDSGFSPGLFTGTGGTDLNRYLLVLNSPQFQSASGLKAGGVLVSDSFFYANPGKSDLIVKGLVGIGTPTPGFPLTIRTSDSLFVDHYGWVHTDGTRELGSYVDSSGGWLGTRSSHSLHFFTGNSSPRMTLDTSGNLGIGTTAPARRLHALTNDLFVARFETNHASSSVVEFRNSSSNSTWEYAVTGSTSVFGLPPGTAYFYRQGAGGNPNIAMTPDGRMQCNVLQIVGGADVAEPFDVSAAGESVAEPGMTVVIDKDHAGKLRVSDQPYDGRVAGVISGANGLAPGMLLKAEGLSATNGEHPVAMTGRVWCRCDAAASAIAPGDLLTTSDVAGHAMKATERERAHGAIIGKAMSGLAAGERGLVLVLVNLQ